MMMSGEDERLRRICSATEDEEPAEGLLLDILNRRSMKSSTKISTKASTETQHVTESAAGATDTADTAAPPARGKGYSTPRGRDEPGPRSAEAGVEEWEREDSQSARMRRMCSGTDDDEAESVALELLNVHSSSFKQQYSSKKSQKYGSPVMSDLDSLNIISVADDWEDDASVAPQQVVQQHSRSSKNMNLDLTVQSGGFLYGNPGVAKSMHSMKVNTGHSEYPIKRNLLKTNSLHNNVQTTPVRPSREPVDPGSPGLIPSSEKMRYDAKEEDKDYADPEEQELSYVDNLFSKIRHNRVGFVAAELQTGCDPAIQVGYSLLLVMLCFEKG
jgi:hypothetical protein